MAARLNQGESTRTASSEIGPSVESSQVLVSATKRFHAGGPIELPVALELILDPACLFGSDGRIIGCNDAWRSGVIETPEVFAPSRWMERLHPSERESIKPRLTDAFVSARNFEADMRLRASTGEYRWHMLRVRVHTVRDGKPRFWLYTLTDIHARKLRKQDLARTIKLQAGMLDVSVDCVKVIQPNGRLSYMNRAGCIALGVDEHSGFGMEWLPLLGPEVKEVGEAALDDARRGLNARFPGLSCLPGAKPRHWDNMLTPLLSPDGGVEAILCVSRDITAQRESEERIAVLMGELNHRSKNQLSVMHALVRRTVPDTRAPWLRTLEQRITSIARSQDLLINGEWTGTTIYDLVVSQTAIAGDVLDERLLLQGDPDLRLHTGTAETIGLALHELTTNAVKYGALSNGSGHVSVRWSIQDGDGSPHLCIDWTESGGPPVKEPERKGFGSLIIERNPRVVSGAKVSCHYPPTGFVWHFEAPARSVLAG
ncbi:sensor histidine kinase [Edaphosphingomonas haloaromaticamans]|uniref:histidine kinase n=1 Tax=Edaphosphingomonas haloaromaticamans TaxID=653954 RepID=A0A1S1H8L9_9SPHN|nr:PAS domain-containing protein [Sphingomonas haloaromaticamans]OHT18559.1 Blue-light-activated histidine kinase [Sphingomonas haloaromaticamans]